MKLGTQLLSIMGLKKKKSWCFLSLFMGSCSVMVVMINTEFLNLF